MEKGRFTDIFRAMGVFLILTWKQKILVFKTKFNEIHTAEGWLLLLQRLALYDKYADSAKKYAGRIYGYWLWTGPIALIIIFILNSNKILRGFYLNVALFSALGMILIGIFFYLVYLVYKSINLENYIGNCLLPLLTVLKEETNPEAPIEIKMDLGKKTASRNIIKQTTNFKMPLGVLRFLGYSSFLLLVVSALIVFVATRFTNNDDTLFGLSMGLGAVNLIYFIASFFIGPKYPRIITTFYLYPYLELKTILREGTSLRITGKDLARKRKVTKSKTNARGKTKIKTKIKYKSKSKLMIQLGFQKRDFTVENKQPNTTMTIEDKPRRTSIKVKRQAIFDNLEDGIKFNTLLSGMKDAYQKLSPVA